MPTYRVYNYDDDGQPQQADFKTAAALVEAYEQIGLEQDSYAIKLHGEPMLRGLIGPMSEGKTIVKYEDPKLFVIETEVWAKQKKCGKADSPAESDPEVFAE